MAICHACRLMPCRSLASNNRHPRRRQMTSYSAASGRAEFKYVTLSLCDWPKVCPKCGDMIVHVELEVMKSCTKADSNQSDSSLIRLSQAFTI